MATVKNIVDTGPNGGVPAHACLGVRVAFAADTNVDGETIDKTGRLVSGVAHPAFSSATVLAFKVGLTTDVLQPLTGVAIDITAAGVARVDELAEWPIVEPFLDVADTGTIEFAFC